MCVGGCGEETGLRSAAGVGSKLQRKCKQDEQKYVSVGLKTGPVLSHRETCNIPAVTAVRQFINDHDKNHNMSSGVRSTKK
jgi:hypothetical protein